MPERPRREFTEVRKGSFSVITGADIRHPLQRDKQSSKVGFCRPAKFAADLFPHSGVKPTLRSAVGFVCL